MTRLQNIHTAKISGYMVYALQGYNISCLALRFGEHDIDRVGDSHVAQKISIF